MSLSIQSGVVGFLAAERSSSSLNFFFRSARSEGKSLSISDCLMAKRPEIYTLGAAPINDMLWLAFITALILLSFTFEEFAGARTYFIAFMGGRARNIGDKMIYSAFESFWRWGEWVAARSHVVGTEVFFREFTKSFGEIKILSDVINVQTSYFYPNTGGQHQKNSFSIIFLFFSLVNK